MNIKTEWPPTEPRFYVQLYKADSFDREVGAYLSLQQLRELVALGEQVLQEVTNRFA